MFTKTLMTAAFALAAVGGPALAQTTGTSGGDTSGGMQSGTMGGTMQGGSTQGGTMGGSMGGTTMSDGAASDGSMTSTAAPKMSRSQMASMKKCQAMPSDKMMKNKTCTRLQKMHPEMTGSSM